MAEYHALDDEIAEPSTGRHDPLDRPGDGVPGTRQEAADCLGQVVYSLRRDVDDTR